MKTGSINLGYLCALAILAALVLACGMNGPKPQWTKVRKVAGKEQGLSHISGLVVDDHFAYVAMGGNLADQKEGHSGLRRISLDSGEVTRIDTPDTEIPQSDRGGMADDGKYLYWNASGSIRRVAKDGGKPEIIVSEKVGVGIDMAVDGERIYWVGHGYYSPGQPPMPKPVYFVKKTGGTPEIFADSQNPPHCIAVGAESVYWLTTEGVMKQARTGGPPQALFKADITEGVDELSQDADSLYFGFRARGNSRWALRKVAKSGGDSVALAQRYSLKQVVSDGENIYFFDEDGLTEDVLCRVSKNGGDATRVDTGYSSGLIAQNQTAIVFAGMDDIYIITK